MPFRNRWCCLPWIGLTILLLNVLAAVQPALAQMPPNYDEFVTQVQANVVINNVAWDGTGTRIAAATATGVQIYDNSLTLLASLPTEQAVESVSWNPHEPRFATTQGSTVVVYRWDAIGQQIVPERTLAAQHPLRVALWSPSGQYLAAVGVELRDDTIYNVQDIPFIVVYIWNAWTGEQVNFISTAHPHARTDENLLLPSTNRIVWEPEGAPILAGIGSSVNLEDIYSSENSGYVIFLINVLTGVETRIPLIDPPYSYGYSLDWQPGAGLIAVGTDIATQVYRVAIGSFYAELGIQDQIDVVSWHPSGQYLVSRRSIIDARTGETYGTVDLGVVGRNDIEWHPNGYLMLLLDTANRLSLFDARTVDGFEVIPPQPTITPVFTDTYTPTPTFTLPPTFTPLNTPPTPPIPNASARDCRSLLPLQRRFGLTHPQHQIFPNVFPEVVSNP